MRTTTSILRFQSPLRCPIRFLCDHAVLFQWIIPGVPRSPLGFGKHTATVGHGSLFHYRRQKEPWKEQVQSKKPHSTNHLSANAICLCKWDAKNNTTKSCTICRNILDAECRRVVIDNGPIVRAICFLLQEIAPIEPSHLPICPDRCLYGFLPMHTYLLCQTLSLDFTLEEYLQWEICLQCGVGCLLLRLVHQSIESIRSHMQTLSQWV